MTAHAQQTTRLELGLGAYAQTNTNYVGFPGENRYGYYGPFARTTLNVNPSLAVEAFAFDSTNLVPTDIKVGGHQSLVLGGVKAGIRRKHIGVFGRLDAGAASFTRGIELFERAGDGPGSSIQRTYFRETHFALEPGATFEAYLSRLTILRADVDENLDAIFRTVHPISSSLYESLGGAVPHHLSVSLSIEHRFGNTVDAPGFEPKPEHLSVGAYFPLQIREENFLSDTPALGGGGAWVELPVFRFLSTDLVAFDLPHDNHVAGAQDGGTPFAAFAGPKAGFHRGRFSVFAKTRPGVTRFSRTDFGLIFNSSGEAFATLHPQYQFSLDTGGVFQYAPARHLFLRLEAGDDLIFYHAHSVPYGFPGAFGLVTSPATHNSSLLFLAGAGWRF